MTLFPVKNVHYDIDVVHQGPLVSTLGMIGLFIAFFLNFLHHGVGNCLDLNMALSFAKNKKICYCFVDRTQVKAHNGLAFFLLNC